MKLVQIKTDIDTLLRLRKMAAGKPVAAFLREYSQSTERQKTMSEELDYVRRALMKRLHLHSKLLEKHSKLLEKIEEYLLAGLSDNQHWHWRADARWEALLASYPKDQAKKIIDEAERGYVSTVEQWQEEARRERPDLAAKIDNGEDIVLEDI